MDLKPITDAILADAKKEVDRISDIASTEIAQMYKEFNDKKICIKEKKESELKQKKHELLAAHCAKMKKLEKDARLSAKAQAADMITANARKRILELDPKEYENFLKNIYNKIGEVGKVSLNANDLRRINPNIFSGSRVEKTPAKISGGFIMECDDVIYNLSIDSIFDDKMRETERAIEQAFNSIGREED